MSEKNNLVGHTIIKTSLPAILSICLFILLIFLIILPLINDALMNQKKDAVRRLIESSYSLVESVYGDFLDGRMTEGQAKDKALSLLGSLRYDEGMNNYFWVNTDGPGDRSILLMHPYRQDLVGEDVLYLQDPKGTYIFRDMVDIVREGGEGFTYYEWQYMEDSERIESKVSYVKLFRPWGWIIGTGLYIDDLEREISHITSNITKYILIVLLFIALLLFYTAYRSIKGEQEKNRAEKKLLASRAYLESVIDQMPSALFTCDGDWRIRNCNIRAIMFLKKDREEITGRDIRHLLPCMENISGEIEGQGGDTPGGQYERRLVALDGKEAVVNISVFSIFLEDYPRFVIRMDDITAQVQEENQLMQAQKMETVGNLVGGIAHDFNNIIGGIVGTASLLSMKCDEFETLTREELAGYVSLIDEAGERAADMVQHLLSLSRKQESHFSPLDLNIPVSHIYKMCQSSFDKCIDIGLNVPETPAMTMANITMIEQVLLNLCVNASHAMTIMREEGARQGGILQLQLEKVRIDTFFRRNYPDAVEDEYWCVSVQDSGVGIEKKNLTKIFEPFFTTKGKEQGTGLGLSMVYNIIRQHKGFVDLYSEKGHGTTVKVYLPVRNNKARGERDDRKKDILVKGTGTVLVVDDDRLIRQLAVEILERCGYETLQAADGEEGVEVYEKEKDRIDLVYLDIIMPRKSGEEVFYILREMNPSVKILLSSGFKKDKRVEEIMKMGVDGFLQKPFSSFELSRMVHDILQLDA